MPRLLAFSLSLAVSVLTALLVPLIGRFFVGPQALAEAQRRRILLAALAILAVVASVALPRFGGIGPRAALVLGLLWLWLLYEGYRVVTHREPPEPPSATSTEM